MMTRERIEAIRKRAAEATPGPWTSDDEAIIWHTRGIPDATMRDVVGDADSATDAAFIAHAREDIEALLAEVDRLRAIEALRVDEISRVLDRFRERVGVVGPMPEAPKPEPLTATEAERWAVDVLGYVYEAPSIAAALRRASRGDIPPEVRPASCKESLQVPPAGILDALRDPAVQAAVSAYWKPVAEPWWPIEGARVRTADPLTSEDYVGLGAEARRPGSPGVIDCISVAGVWGWVTHDDGTRAPYDLDELRPADRLCGAVLATDSAGMVL